MLGSNFLNLFKALRPCTDNLPAEKLLVCALSPRMPDVTSACGPDKGRAQALARLDAAPAKEHLSAGDGVIRGLALHKFMMRGSSVCSVLVDSKIGQ